MTWLERMNSAMDYIERNLTGTIDYTQLAQIACCSVYHFQRMFSFISGVALSEYIRRRRLTMAAIELQNKNTKIIDIALKYGYESPEAFSRAFKNMHSVTPTLARNTGITLKAYPQMTFHLSIKGGFEMNYRIEEKEAFDERLSVPALTWLIFPADNCDIPTVWQRIYSEWFPTSDFEQVEGPQFEMYYGKAHNATGEVWIPVRKK
ncbi:MAG: helix-turn-helix domain-containing protein [Cellulosilyticaceae bacterium]